MGYDPIVADPIVAQGVRSCAFGPRAPAGGYNLAGSAWPIGRATASSRRRDPAVQQTAITGYEAAVRPQ